MGRSSMSGRRACAPRRKCSRLLGWVPSSPASALRLLIDRMSEYEPSALVGREIALGACGALMEELPERVSLENLLATARRAARREGLSIADAEDVASMTLLSYVEAANDVRHPNAWIRLVAKRNAWALRRSQGEEERWSRRNESRAVATPSVDIAIDVTAALLSLGPWERLAVLRRDVEEAPLQAIADSSGLPLTTLKRKLKRGRGLLHRALSGKSVQMSFGRTESTMNL
jgi:DNA-directed RNA polymerase specialized sigma24 family protein